MNSKILKGLGITRKSTKSYFSFTRLAWSAEIRILLIWARLEDDECFEFKYIINKGFEAKPIDLDNYNKLISNLIDFQVLHIKSQETVFVTTDYTDFVECQFENHPYHEYIVAGGVHEDKCHNNMHDYLYSKTDAFDILSEME